jgi:hypothetical protein
MWKLKLSTESWEIQQVPSKIDLKRQGAKIPLKTKKTKWESVFFLHQEFLRAEGVSPSDRACCVACNALGLISSTV